MSKLDSNIQYLKHVGPARAQDFYKLGITTVRDLLYTFPRDLSDRSSIKNISDCRADEFVTISARAINIQERSIKRGKSSLTLATLTDDTGIIDSIWFNQPWLKDQLAGKTFLFFGKTKFDNNRLRLEHPQLELLPDSGPSESLNFGRLVPLYPCTGGLTQNIWRKVMNIALSAHLDDLLDFYSPAVLEDLNLLDLKSAIFNMHFPKSQELSILSRKRLVWDECLFLQLAILSARRHIRHDFVGRKFIITDQLDNRIRSLFPFKLTNAQNRCIQEISTDMSNTLPMHRLLQGDVGSGKTVVASYALLAAVANKVQSCIMAPTSILAIQHYTTFKNFLSNSKRTKVHIGLLVGGLKAKEKDILLSRLASGTIDILVATHAALESNIIFNNLGLVIIDEQHKFGVKQRLQLTQKGFRPDTLVMTATPIPRSLALSVYGDLDISVIDELPPGRKNVKTLLFSDDNVSEAWKLLLQELKQGRQAFIVTPLVSENEELNIQSAISLYEDLSQDILQHYKLGLLHGQMKREEQELILSEFRLGRLEVLVSTVVIEVGVDIPNATVMLVANAERFGLAQLHQLRGRVGRGVEQGYFLMLSNSKGLEAQKRLLALLSSNNGFFIAEQDLRIRGPGDFLGIRQHGLSALKLVDLIKDINIMRAARKFASTIIIEDPTLNSPKHLNLQHELLRLYGADWHQISIG